MDRHFEDNVVEDSSGRSASSAVKFEGSEEDTAKLFASILSMEKFSEGIDWLKWAIEDKPRSKDKPASADAHAKLQEAYDGLSMKTRSLKKIAAEALMGGLGDSVHVLAKSARELANKCIDELVQAIESKMFMRATRSGAIPARMKGNRSERNAPSSASAIVSRKLGEETLL